MKNNSTIVEKPWGHEVIFANHPRYVGKVLHIREGERLSLQYHEKKEETIYLSQGELLLEIGEKEGELQEIRLLPGESYHIPAGYRHRMTALATCDIFEASTSELDDVVRLQDNYGRV